MEATYKWELKNVTGKPVFTDKFGNVRENVIKTVILEYVGQLGDKTEKQELVVDFSLADLSSFVEQSTLSANDVIQMALSYRPAGQIESIETIVKNKFFEDNSPSSFVTFEFE
jgi:hypothetical protein